MGVRKFSQIAPVPMIYSLLLRFRAGAMRFVALLPEASQILCTFEVKYFYNFTREMHI